MSGGAYHNIFVPPTATVEKDVAPIGAYVVFDKESLLRTFHVRGDENLQTAVDRYVQTNADRLARERRPSGYMIGIGTDGFGKLYKDGMVETTGDLPLTINILGRTVNGMYIPDRPLRFDARNLPDVVLFLKSEVYA